MQKIAGILINFWEGVNVTIVFHFITQYIIVSLIKIHKTHRAFGLLIPQVTSFSPMPLNVDYIWTISSSDVSSEPKTHPILYLPSPMISNKHLKYNIHIQNQIFTFLPQHHKYPNIDVLFIPINHKSILWIN